MVHFLFFSEIAALIFGAQKLIPIFNREYQDWANIEANLVPMVDVLDMQSDLTSENAFIGVEQNQENIESSNLEVIEDDTKKETDIFKMQSQKKKETSIKLDKDVNSKEIKLLGLYDQEEYNLDTALLIEPNNEEVILMLMKVALKKSNYSKVKDLSQTFTKVCEKLCDENDEIQKSLKNIEPQNES